MGLEQDTRWRVRRRLRCKTVETMCGVLQQTRVVITCNTARQAKHGCNQHSCNSCSTVATRQTTRLQPEKRKHGCKQLRRPTTSQASSNGCSQRLRNTVATCKTRFDGCNQLRHTNQSQASSNTGTAHAQGAHIHTDTRPVSVTPIPARYR